MDKIQGIDDARVFEYFKEICSIPRGSGNMEKISEYCMNFAKKHSLKANRDEYNNVIIFKDGTKGYENSKPVILQGHLDMVCQKEEGYEIDFERDGLSIYEEDGYLKARGTTLGADNGIAVAMIMVILESDNISHPPIEAVFTTDEEIGMIGAGKLAFDLLKGRKMINIDCEDPKEITVSCAGGSDFLMTIPLDYKKVCGTKVKITVKGLKGGHSGVEINSGRVNSNILMGRLLNKMRGSFEFDLVNISGGDKANAIPLMTTAEVVTENSEEFIKELELYVDTVKEEIKSREPQFSVSTEIYEEKEYEVLKKETRDKIIYTLLTVPNGVMEMSMEIENLVETSLNLGILKTEDNKVLMHFALRSNKQSALDFLEERLRIFSIHNEFSYKTGGHYPPWEFKNNSELQEIYKEEFKKKFGFEPEVVAIHAGLECGIFASKIENLDCIAIGPEMEAIHTVNERLSISSVKEMFDLILNVLQKCK